MKDANLIVTRTIAAAGASNASSGIDFGARVAPNGITPEHLQLQLVIPDVAALADAKTLTVTLEHSDDDSTYVTTNMAVVLTGASSAGATGGTYTFRPLPAQKRYLRVSTAVASSGGTLTASTVTLSVVIP